MRTRVFTAVAISLCVMLAAAEAPTRAQQQPGAPPSTSGIDPAAMDRSVDACTDFYAFACGGWVAKHPVPADRSSYSRFTELQDRNDDILHQILEKASANASDADARKSGDYYASCMDEPGIAAKGLAPLADDLKRIGSVNAPSDVAPVVAALHAKGVRVFFGLVRHPTSRTHHA